MTLVRYIFRDHLIGHVAAAATKIPPRPHVAPPKLLLQMRELPQQLVRRLPLQPLYQPADRHLRRYRHEQMYMIFRYMPLHNRHFVLTTNLSDHISYSQRYFSRQRRTTIFRAPYQMQVNLNCMRTPSIFFHLPTLSYRRANVLKLSPKGEGFDPPKVRQ